MMVSWSGEVQVEYQVQFELDIGGRETCVPFIFVLALFNV